MAKEILINDINDLIEMIRDQFHIISRHEGKIPQIEMDIIMSNIRKLYDDFFELDKMNQKYKPETGQEELKQPQTIIEPVVKFPINEQPQREEESKEIFQSKEEKPVEPSLSKEPMLKKNEEPLLKDTREINKTKETHKSPQKKPAVGDLFAGTESIPLADKFKEEKKSLYDKIASEKKEKTIADTILSPIGDLRTGIGVNDRFLFINELFKGGMQDYNYAIEEINRQTNIDDAMQKFGILKELYGWKDDSDAMSRMLGFIKRRFV